MVLQLVLNAFTAFLVCITVYLTYTLSAALKSGTTSGYLNVCCFLQHTPALDTFLMFVIRAAFFTAATAYVLGHISNHIIISLDIIYYINIMILILYHALKESGYPSVKVI